MAKADRKLTCFAKRHYEAIAEAMQEARTHLRCDAINQHECVIGMLAFHQCVPARRKHEGAIMSTVPMYGAVMTLARYQARKEIKRQLYAKGIKLAHVESREITIAANKYIDEHPEIITFATQDYHRLVASGRLRPPRQKKLCST
ncbi:MAG: hypothetical protein WBZ23_10340 [Pseudolabrys sp.]